MCFLSIKRCFYCLSSQDEYNNKEYLFFFLLYKAFYKGLANIKALFVIMVVFCESLSPYFLAKSLYRGILKKYNNIYI